MNVALLLMALGGLGTLPQAMAQQATPAPAAVTSVAHPLIQWKVLPQWSQLTPKQMMTDIRHCLALSRARLDAICTISPEQATWDNTFGAFESMDHELDTALRLFHHLANTMDSPEMRQAEETMTPEITEFTSSIVANEKLWQVLRAAASQAWVKDLSPEKQRYVQLTIDSFRDQGADLTPEAKARKIQIEKEMAALEMVFDKNVLDSTKAWYHLITDKAQLAGMSDTWLAKAAAAAAKHGFGTQENPQWLITLQTSSVMEVLRHCEVENTRKICWLGRNTIGNTPEHDNAPIVAKIMELRCEMAKLLGFNSFADFQNIRRMSGSGEAALQFVDGVMQQLRPTFEKECHQIIAFASQKSGKKLDSIPAWDLPYYRTAYDQEFNKMDPDALRPYFVFENVYRGIFNLYEHLYGIRIERQAAAVRKPGDTLPKGTAEIWHPDVLLFKVTDKQSGDHLGSFYIDPFPRDTKQAGAWILGLHYGLQDPKTGKHTPHLATLCANVTSPTADKPALLSQLEVTILFHEMGHMMHCMLGNTELKTHCGTNVTRDFVEMPSQLAENWAWTPEGLAFYAHHYQTGKLMPQELQQKLFNSRYTLPSLEFIRQLCIAKLDLEMHSHYTTQFQGKNLESATCNLLDSWCIPGSNSAPSIIRRLKHCISGGYKAGYYAYQWAEVLSADGFSRFKNEGITNPTTGAAFRKTILSQGNSQDPLQLFQNFMGRKPNPNAHLQTMSIHT